MTVEELIQKLENFGTPEAEIGIIPGIDGMLDIRKLEVFKQGSLIWIREVAHDRDDS